MVNNRGSSKQQQECTSTGQQPTLNSTFIAICG